MNVRGKTALVVGLARSGVAAANFLSSAGCRVTVTDVKSERELARQTANLREPVHRALGGHRTSDFLQADFIVLSPGVPASLPELEEARRQGVPVLGEIELAFAFLRGRVIAVTGSNGKTTTTTLIANLLREGGVDCVVAGNIGTPLVGFAQASGVPPERTYVVELSSFQLETIERFRPDVAVVLNVTPDHQDRYAGFEEYAAAKERIFLNQKPSDLAVLNADDPVTLEMAGRRTSEVLLFSRKRELDRGICLKDGLIEVRKEGRTVPVLLGERVRLKGAHNLENVLAAVAVGDLCGLDPETMVRTLLTFAGVEHRLEFVRRLDDVDYYNDSKATNVESTLQAVRAFDQPLILILGGKDKGDDFSRLIPEVQLKTRLTILIGSAADRIEQALGRTIPCRRAESLDIAVRAARDQARPGDVVLLSPACASFDMFRDFEHRGKFFKTAVSALNPRRERSAVLPQADHRGKELD